MVDLDEARKSKEAPKIPRYFDDVAVSPESSTLAVVASSLTGRLWNGVIAVGGIQPVSSPVTLSEVADSTVEIDAGCSCVEWVSEERLVVASDTGALDVWSYNKDEKRLQQQMTLAEHHDACSCLSFNSILNQIVTGSWDKSIKVWDLAVELSIHTLKAHFDRILAVAWSELETNMMLSASQDGRVVLYDNAKTKPASLIFSSHDLYPTDVEFHPEDSNVVAIGDVAGKLQLFDLRTTKEPLHSFKPHEKQINKIVFPTPRTDLVATCSDDCSVVVTNWKDGTTRCSSKCHNDYTRGLCWSPHKASLISCAWDGTISIPFNLSDQESASSAMDMDGK